MQHTHEILTAAGWQPAVTSPSALCLAPLGGVWTVPEAEVDARTAEGTLREIAPTPTGAAPHAYEPPPRAESFAERMADLYDSRRLEA